MGINRANIREVARRAGVSPATVSRSLRGSPAVASATRDRVLAAAHDLSYSLPAAAGAGSAGLVAVLARFPGRWFFAQAITAVEAALAEAGRRLVLHDVGTAQARRRFFELLPSCSYEGLIVVSSSFDAGERAALDGLGIPIAVVGGHLPGAPTVTIDEVAGARTAVEHLIGLGHRRIGMISFDGDRETVGVHTTQGRRRGFEQALLDNGLEVVPEWIIQPEGSRMEGGVRAAELLLSRPRLPTALFAMSDELAIGALRAIRRAGLSVPGAMSVVGFDDHEIAEFVDLTTIHQPVELQARAAVGLLDAAASAPAERIDLPLRLVVRGTTGPPA